MANGLTCVFPCAKSEASLKIEFLSTFKQQVCDENETATVDRTIRAGGVEPRASGHAVGGFHS
jgi:hypothetical protein